MRHGPTLSVPCVGGASALMYWFPNAGPWGGMGWIGMAFMILFWIAVAIGIVYLVRHLVARPSQQQSPNPSVYGPGSHAQEAQRPHTSALQILEERYARGEIDQAEFLARRADLTGQA
jgi:putative membrane protein